MTRRNTFLAAAWILSTLCLAGGFAAVGQWVGAAAALLAGLAWQPARRHPETGLPALCLAGSVFLAASGALSGALDWLMVLGSGAALAVWDILLLNADMIRSGDGEQTVRYESRHLRSLGLALACGLSAAILGRPLSLQPPFFLLLALVALAAVGMDRVWRYIRERTPARIPVNEEPRETE